MRLSRILIPSFMIISFDTAVVFAMIISKIT
nr:MAG TPA: hypothetical protein [Caudoviricetes sp.]